MEIRQNGSIELDGFTITNKTKIVDLPKYFTHTSVTQLQVLNEVKPIQFSAAEIELSGNTVHLSLRFEEDMLVSVFITIKEFDKPYKTAVIFITVQRKGGHNTKNG